MTTTNRSAINSIGWSVVDKWGTRLTSLVVILILGRILDTEAFGVVAMATIYIALASVFVDSGFGRSLVQKGDLTENDKSTVFWINVALGALLTGMTLVAARPISHFAGMAILEPVLQALSITLILNGLSSAPAALLEREFQFKTLAMRRAVGTLGGAVAAILCAIGGLGVWSLVVQTLTTAVLSTIILWAASSWRPKLTFSKQSFMSLRTVGFSVVGIELVAYVNSQADKFIVAAFLDVQTLGLYYIALQITTVVTSLFSSVFGNISLTTFSRVQQDENALVSWFLKLTSISSMTALPFFSLVAATAPTLIPFMLGPQWAGSVPIIQILALLGAINSAIMFDRNLLIAVGQGRRAFQMTLGQTILGIAIIVPSVNFGVLGVAAAIVLRQYLFWPFRIHLVRRSIPLPIWSYLKGWLAPATVAVASFAGAIGTGYMVSKYWTDEPLGVLAIQVIAALGVTLAGYFVVAPNALSQLRQMISKKTGPKVPSS